MNSFRLIATAAVIAGLAPVGSALAADLPSRAAPPYVAPETYSPQGNWQGAYVGAHVGGGFGSVGPANTSGLVGGVHGGYNAQFGQVVVGGEADVTASDVRNKTYTTSTRQPWLGSARARVGYSFGNVMAYGTGGLAFAQTDNRTPYGRHDSTDAGYVLGAGAEFLVQPNVTLRGEYLYYDVGNTKYPTALGPASAETHTNVLRAGASYKF